MFPASQHTVCLFAQFLSRSFTATSSVQNYISGVKKLHLMLGCQFPQDSFELKLAIKGLQRKNPHCPRQAAPITPAMLIKIHKLLDCHKPFDAVFWSLFLTAFFTLARNSNLVQTGSCKQAKQVTRGDISIQADMVIVTFRWTKTIQYGQRKLQVPMVAIPGSVLCPVQAYTQMLSLVPGSEMVPAFSLPSNSRLKPVTYSQFMQVLRALVARIGLAPGEYSTHSFRRGGATFAFKSQVPGELIKTQGDWTSDAYLRYLDLSMESRLQVAVRMGHQILKDS